MSWSTTADFYYGTALSVIFNNSNGRVSAALIESDGNRQLYKIMIDDSEYRLFIKYRFAEIATKTEDYYGWLFTLTKNDKSEIQSLMNKGYNLVLALVCGVAGLSDSELALIDKEQVKELIDLERDFIIIGCKKGDHVHRISIGIGDKDAMKIKTNRVEELF